MTNIVKMANLPKAMYTFITIYTLSQLKLLKSILHRHKKTNLKNILEALKTRIFKETVNRKNTMELSPHMITNYAMEP